MKKVYLGLGGNLGDRRQALAEAVRTIRAWSQVTTVAVSSLYETEYVGPGRQRPYFNACMELRTGVSARALLARAQATERAAGRRPDGHLQPRSLDVDLLLYGSEQVREPQLVVPHPQLTRRRFVLEPLVELGVETIPGSEHTAREWLVSREVSGQHVRRVEGHRWWEREAA